MSEYDTKGSWTAPPSPQRTPIPPGWQGGPVPMGFQPPPTAYRPVESVYPPVVPPMPYRPIWPSGNVPPGIAPSPQPGYTGAPAHIPVVTVTGPANPMPPFLPQPHPAPPPFPGAGAGGQVAGIPAVTMMGVAPPAFPGQAGQTPGMPPLPLPGGGSLPFPAIAQMASQGVMPQALPPQGMPPASPPQGMIPRYVQWPAPGATPALGPPWMEAWGQTVAGKVRELLTDPVIQSTWAQILAKAIQGQGVPGNASPTLGLP